MTPASAQAELFDIVPQPRNVKPEPREVYDAIVKLRKSGLVVLRRGRTAHAIYKRNWGLRLVKIVGDRSLIETARRLP